MTTGDMRDKSKVQAVERALDILSALAECRGEKIAITELASACGLKLSTCHRLLTTMAVKGYVRKDPATNHYGLGQAAVKLAQHPYSKWHLSKCIRPIMDELAAQTQETVNLAILEETDVLFIDQIEPKGDRATKMFAGVGRRGPAYCTGSGKALLAGLPDAELNLLLSSLRFEKFTSETIDDAHKLKMELVKIKTDGYSLDLGERDEGVRCVAVPIKGSTGTTECAISVAGPSSRLTNFYLNHELINLVCEAARKASYKLGYLSRTI